MDTGKNVMTSPLAGTWYSADRTTLEAEVDKLIRGAAPEPVDGPVCALIQPHAGYRYSGAVAAHGMKLVQGRKYRRVIVMGPSHHVALTDRAALPDATHILTPLGELPLDREAMARLLQTPWFTVSAAAHRSEHSVGIHLPLLQRALAEFELVPVVVGQLTRDGAQAIADALRPVVDDQTLLIASTDFTHYGTGFGYVPFRGDVQDNLRKLDLDAFELIRQKDPDGFSGYCRRTGATICGRDPVQVLLRMLPAETEIRLLAYDTSGRMEGDFATSVSYVSAAVTGTWSTQTSSAAADEETASPHASPSAAVRDAGAGEGGQVALGDDDRQQLLRLARETLQSVLRFRRQPTLEELGIEPTPGMRRMMGAFVTLHRHGQLRGCIGEIEPRRPLWEAVMENAIHAALRDPRFLPVNEQELMEIDIEISALTSPVPVDSWRQIEIGQHGIVLRKSGRSSVFLPQVAPEQGWDLETTLTHLSRKAGLASDAWRDDASFLVFEAIVFGEVGSD